jgi:hypothetical protein
MPLRLQSLQFLSHSRPDDGREIPVRHFGAHQNPQAIELVAKRGIGGELHPVPRRRERLDSVWTESKGQALDSVWTESGLRILGPGGYDIGLLRVRIGRQRPIGQSPDQRRRVRPWGQLGHDLLDLTLGLVHGARQKSDPVLGREVGRQLRDPREVQPAVREHGQNVRVRTRRPRHRDPEVGLVLGQVENVRAVDEHRWSSEAGVEPPRLHFPDVGDDVRFHGTGLAQEIAESLQEVLVGKGIEQLFE